MIPVRENSEVVMILPRYITMPWKSSLHRYWIRGPVDRNPYPLVNIQKAIENGPFIVDSPIDSMVIFIKHGGSFHMFHSFLVCLPGGLIAMLNYHVGCPSINPPIHHGELHHESRLRSPRRHRAPPQPPLAAASPARQQPVQQGTPQKAPGFCRKCGEKMVGFGGFLKS